MAITAQKEYIRKVIIRKLDIVREIESFFSPDMQKKIIICNIHCSKQWVKYLGEMQAALNLSDAIRNQRLAAASFASRARNTFSGVMGNSVIQTPMASCSALTMAGDAGLAVISPIPLAPKGPSVDGHSTMTV
jgi:hypothetical protein